MSRTWVIFVLAGRGNIKVHAIASSLAAPPAAGWWAAGRSRPPPRHSSRVVVESVYSKVVCGTDAVCDLMYRVVTESIP